MVYTGLDDLNSTVATITIAEELTKTLKEHAEQANKTHDMHEQLQESLRVTKIY